MDKLDMKTKNKANENFEKLSALFPNAVTETINENGELVRAIDKDVLMQEISCFVVEGKEERYQFTWPDKKKSIVASNAPINKTLRPCREESVDFDNTQNLYIEGDNLEVLKLLQETYMGKIKMIYIDPPYNRGTDFVYHDDFSNSLKAYMEQTNQNMASNPETNGRYHSDWLNMMYPRLVLAKNLLKENGVIFISIDDNEQENLKKICSEVFGEQNFIANFIWEKKKNRENRKIVSEKHDYILCYVKNINFLTEAIHQLPMNEESLSRYKNPDNDPLGDWKSDPAHAQAGHGTKNQFYDLIAPNGKVHKLPSGRCWIYSEEVMKEKIKEGKIWFGIDGNNVPRKKTYLNEKDRGLTPETIIYADVASTNDDAKNRIKELFDGIAVFDTPKPVELIYNFLEIACPDEYVLDFFAGSSVTAEAVMKYNYTFNKFVKCISVQIPEKCESSSVAYKEGYENICEIGKERIRKAGEKIRLDWETEHKNGNLFDSNEELNLDIGFKVFKLDSTNINPWDNEHEMDENSLFSMQEVFKEDRSNEDILYEIMLKYGVFDYPVTNVDINGKTMYRVGKRYMLVCLENNVTEDDIKEIISLHPRVVIFKEAGFKTDNDKINAEYNLQKNGVEDIKCI